MILRTVRRAPSPAPLALLLPRAGPATAPAAAARGRHLDCFVVVTPDLGRFAFHLLRGVRHGS